MLISMYVESQRLALYEDGVGGVVITSLIILISSIKTIITINNQRRSRCQHVGLLGGPFLIVGGAWPLL